MLVLGIDAHKRTHTVVAIDSTGRKLGEKVTTATTTADHLDMLRWAEQLRHRAALGGGGLPASVKRLVKRAGIDKRISPHSLRHSFVTAALDAGVPLRDIQEAARHADPLTTMRYDRARRSLDRHATYIVSTFIAGATRPA